jgi:hypothetical protein
MSEPKLAESPLDAPSREEMTSALFAQLVMQQANMAMMLLGKIAHPESGQVIKEIEAARLFIDQLEMLEVKTKGNLTKEEAALLKQGLMSSRLAFVQAMDSPQPQAGAKPAEPAPPPPSAPAVDPGQAAPADDDHRKKFSKKY